MSPRVSTVVRAALVAVALAAAVPALHGTAEARAGGGGSFGSRGARSFSMPSSTATAPRSAQPFERSMGERTGAQPGRFGFGTGLMAGLLGASLFAGLGGGLGGAFSLLFNIALLGGAVWVVFRLVRAFSGRTATAGGPSPAQAGFAPRASGTGPAAVRPLSPDSLGPDDYAAFETSLRSVQEAFSREDVAALQRLAVPEIAREFERELVDNQQRGVRNDVSGTQLIAGDLSEAWQEGQVTFATVAMRFGAIDVVRERKSGRVVSGDASQPTVATELWTFVRTGLGSPWRLSAIQQAA